MSLLKNMEAVFIATMALTVSTAYVLETMPEAHARAPFASAASASMPVVVVSAKRMTAEEKRESLRQESQFATEAGDHGSRI